MSETLPVSDSEKSERQRLLSGEPHVLSLALEAPFDEGLNGRVLGILEFPPQSGYRAKRVAIVDYGEDFAGKPLRAEAPGMGRVDGRVGLRGINYVADSHLALYADLPKGEVVTLGRKSDVHNASYMLGLVNDEPGNARISREHIDIRYDGGEVIVIDRSSQGTIFESASE